MYKIFQNDNTYPCGRKGKEETSTTPSDYLQKHFKTDFKTKTKNDNINIKQILENLELIQNKFKSKRLITYLMNKKLFH